MGYKKVMVLAEKVCSSRFRNTPDFYSYLNSKGLYGSPKSKYLFCGHPVDAFYDEIFVKVS